MSSNYNRLFYSSQEVRRESWRNTDRRRSGRDHWLGLGWAFVSYPRPAESIQAAAPERILIAYYSQSGHTEAVAKAIQQETGGDLYHIRTNIAYPKNAPAMQSQAKAEYNEGLRPSLAEPMPDMSRYDVVLLGFPIGIMRRLWECSPF